MDDPCIMYMGRGVCDALNDTSNCGPECVFRKTVSQQREIEEKIVKRFESGEGVPLRNYRSCIDDSLLYPAFGDWSNAEKEER